MTDDARPRPATPEDVRRSAEVGDLIFQYWCTYGCFPTKSALEAFKHTQRILESHEEKPD